MTDWQTKSVDNWLTEHFSGESLAPRTNSFDSDQRPGMEDIPASSGDDMLLERTFIKDKQAGTNIIQA